MKTLNQVIELMNKINETKDYYCYFSNGKLIVESRIIEFMEFKSNGTGNYRHD